MAGKVEYIREVHKGLLRYVKACDCENVPEKGELVRIADDTFVAILAFMHEENMNSNDLNREEIEEMGKLWSDIPVFCQYLWQKAGVLNERQEHVRFFNS